MWLCAACARPAGRCEAAWRANTHVGQVVHGEVIIFVLDESLAHILVLLGLLVNELEHELVLVGVPCGDVQISLTFTFEHLAQRKLGGVFALLLRQLLRLEGVLDGWVHDAFEDKRPPISDGDGQLTCVEEGCGAAGPVPVVRVVALQCLVELFADRLGQETAGGEAGGRAERGRRVKGRESSVEGEHLFQTFLLCQMFRRDFVIQTLFNSFVDGTAVHAPTARL